MGLNKRELSLDVIEQWYERVRRRSSLFLYAWQDSLFSTTSWGTVSVCDPGLAVFPPRRVRVLLSPIMHRIDILAASVERYSELES